LLLRTEFFVLDEEWPTTSLATRGAIVKLTPAFVTQWSDSSGRKTERWTAMANPQENPGPAVQTGARGTRVITRELDVISRDPNMSS
jgi:hypothetical protein